MKDEDKEKENKLTEDTKEEKTTKKTKEDKSIEEKVEKKVEVDKKEELKEEKITEEIENKNVEDNSINDDRVVREFNNENVYYNDTKKEKNNFKVLFIFVTILCILCFIGAILSFALNSNSSKKNNNSNDNSDVELKYTEIQNAKEGVYLVDVSDVVSEVMPSIVSITSQTLITSGQYGPGFFGYGNSDSKRYATGAGSGIIVSKTSSELMILTNKHVIEDSDKLSVQFINGKNVDATVKGYSSSKDIAIITIKLSDIDKDTLNNIKIATMGSSDNLKVGQGIIAIGNALGYGQSVTVGVISALNREVSTDTMTMNMIQIDAAINGGNSGGALLNSRGEVIGINSAKYSSNALSSSASIEGMGFAIPISDVSELITNLMNGKALSDEERGYLGISGYMITSEMSKSYNMPEGFYVSSIVRGTGAYKSGLSIGNIITEIEGKKVTKFSDISEVLETKKATEKVKIKVKYVSGTEYKEKNITISLSTYKEVNS